MQTGQRVAAFGMAVSGALALVKIAAGLSGHSTAVVADGLESASDVFASGFVLLGLTLAAIPPDENHPYGHGRVETLTGLLIGLVLTAGGVIISFASLQHLGQPRQTVAAFVIYPLLASLVAKACLAAYKFRYGRLLNSDSLTADAWNDTMDSVSAVAALIAVGLTLADPNRFREADRYGGFIVGLIVVTTGIRVVYDTAMQLMDTMPSDVLMTQLREAARDEPGVRGVEKCFARKTGLKYHVDLHLEVDPEMTVRQSHDIAHQVRLRIMQRLDWVADVLVHVEPAP
ncbi:MAG TPA: cation diffusion facilitator family transporter [Candidatus Sulfopaludibacter sp.]|jgi:cation diffusion facilitator family transporter|nr:cation diffusion facilitator family transporter [Candidatus Sulfopaludibacter sp.]